MDDALDWLKRNHKQPKECDEVGLWRWTNPDDGSQGRRAEELPPDVFDRLQIDPCCSERRPWLFKTPVHAWCGAILALLAADQDGLFPEG